MLRRVALALAFLFSLVASGQAQTADEIVAKEIAALGGVDKIKAIQTARSTGTMTLGQGIEAPVVIEVKRPNKVRTDFEIQGAQNTQAYDGQTAWMFVPAQGMKAPEPAPAEVTKILEEQADIDGSFVDYKAKGNQIELVGKEAVQGTDAYKLKITNKAGDFRFLYLDAEHFLPIKTELKRPVNGAERTITTYMSDYKPVGGVLMTHAIESTIEGLGTQKVVLSKIEVNVPIDDARFKMPAAKGPGQ